MRAWWGHLSVRVRLTLWYTGTLAVVLLLYAGGVFIFLKHSLSAELDRQLREDFESSEQQLERTADGSVRLKTTPHHDEDEDEAKGIWLEVWSLEGKLLYRSPWFVTFAPQNRRPQLGQERYTFESVEVAGHDHLRLLSGSYSLNGIPLILRVGRSEKKLHDDLRRLLLILGLGLPLALAVAGFGGYALARGALAPVGRMADRARSITAERLGERLAVENPDDELGQLATVFNETFARLERSFEQLRRFTADASHELRTPLTAIRSVGEVGLQEHRDEKSYREIIGSMLEEVDRLARLVDSLLMLSRADAGHLKLNPEQVDLTELSREVASHLGVLAEEKRQSISIESTGSALAIVDRLVLRQAVINLLDNAIKYSPDGASIRIAVHNLSLGPRVEVIDVGPGIPAEHQQRVFDRFYRADKARSREMDGTGLGLSIARWAVEVHGGRIELDSEEGQGSTFRILLPPS